MGIFDVIELENHVQAIGEYIFYLDTHPDEMSSVHVYIVDHLKNMRKVLDKMKNSP